ncbi:Ionotropic receptor 248, partial [Frankliniella occidentalis]
VLAERREQDPEVPCALALIPPLFELGDSDAAAHAPRLYVFGKARWINEFLRRFPSVASVYLFSGTEITTRLGDFITAGMMPSSAVALVLPDASSFLGYVPYRVRVLKWESFNLTSAGNRIYQMKRGDVERNGLCHRFLRYMVTTRPTYRYIQSSVPTNTTHVFAARISCDLIEVRPETTYELLGVWSPGTGWSSPGVSLFPPPCISWRPPPDGQPLLAEMLGYELEKYDSNNPFMVKYFKSTGAYEVLRLLRDKCGFDFETRFNFTTDTVAYPLRAAESCRLDIKGCSVLADSLSVLSHTELSVFPWDNHGFVCVVPAAAGRPYHIFYPITAEFPAAVWSSLAAVVIATVTCLYVLRRGKSVQQLILVTLAPLLAQPLDGKQAKSQRPLLGSWFLTCLVVVAAYQGRLLSFILNPPVSREIDSWQDWVESDLLLLVNHQFRVAMDAEGHFPGLTQDRLRVIVPTYDAMIAEVVTHRNVSFVADKYNFEIVKRNISQELRSKIHTFEMNTFHFASSCFATTKGSPLEVPLRKLLGRIRSAGGVPYRTLYKIKLQQTAEKAVEPDQVQNENKAIAIRNLRPVILIYVVGNLVSILSFLIERFRLLIVKYAIIVKIKMRSTTLYLVALCLLCSSTICLIIIFFRLFLTFLSRWLG